MTVRDADLSRARKFLRAGGDGKQALPLQGFAATFVPDFDFSYLHDYEGSSAPILENGRFWRLGALGKVLKRMKTNRMDSEKIKLLRSRIAIPLNTAIRLLQQNQGDVDASEQAFHEMNIIEISARAECDPETAREAYLSCAFDIQKAAEKINSRPVILTTRENPAPRNEIGFVLWPRSKDGENYKTPKRNDAFVPTADFEHVIHAFRSVFPLKNPWNQNIEQHFDIRGFNTFDKETCKIIIETLKQSKTADANVLRFQHELIEWLNDKVVYADYITVYGNL